MGQMVAHILTGKMMDFIDLSNDFVIVKTRTPADLVGKNLSKPRSDSNTA